MTGKELARRVAPLLPYITSGEIAMDDTLGRGVAAYLEEHHRNVTRPS